MTPVPQRFSDPRVLGVLNSLPSGVSLADTSGRIVFSNQSADRILGMGAYEGAPESWAEHYGIFLPDGDTPFPVHDHPLIRALHGEEVEDVEMRIRNSSVPGGATISVSGRPLRNPMGKIVGSCAVFRDITAIRAAHRELERTNAELEATQRAKDDMIAFLVHDLRSPITSIRMLAELMLTTETFNGQEVREDAAEVLQATEELNRMIGDLLDIQRAADGALTPEVNDVVVVGLLRNVERAMRRKAFASGQEIRIAGFDPELRATCDESLVSRVVANLVNNCITYGPSGGTITMGAGAPAGVLRLWVQDEGPGVPDHLKERIFDKYARAERNEGPRSGDSRGLGLRFCRVAAEAHGGRIWVEDVEPRGARFCVELGSGHPRA